MKIPPQILIALYAVLTAIVLFFLYQKRRLIIRWLAQNFKEKEMEDLPIASDFASSNNCVGEIQQLTGENELLKSKITELESHVSECYEKKTEYERNADEKNEDIEAFKTEIEKLKTTTSENIQSKEVKIVELNDEILKKETFFQTELDKLNLENKNLQNKISELERTSELRKMGFKVQSLMSAGPRKTTRDPELGEDISGFITKGDDLYFWVLDGTSDEAYILIDGVGEVFSCRKLALQLSYQLGESASKKYFPDTNSWVNDSIKAVLNEWKNLLLNDKIHFHTKNYVATGNKNVATFKTTLAVGRWNCVNGRLEVFRIGDSKIVAFNQFGKVELFQNELKDQVTFQIVLENEILKVYDFDNSDNIQTVTKEEIIGLIAFSDGLSKTSERYISEDFYSWKDVVENRQQLTNDDKTLLIASIVQ